MSDAEQNHASALQHSVDSLTSVYEAVYELNALKNKIIELRLNKPEKIPDLAVVEASLKSLKRASNSLNNIIVNLQPLYPAIRRP